MNAPESSLVLVFLSSNLLIPIWSDIDREQNEIKIASYSHIIDDRTPPHLSFVQSIYKHLGYELKLVHLAPKTMIVELKNGSIDSFFRSTDFQVFQQDGLLRAQHPHYNIPVIIY